jgi:hypothetical protein
MELHIVKLCVVLTDKISLSRELSLAVGAAVGLGMGPGVSCTQLNFKDNLIVMESNTTKLICAA